jgi:hypothetical protein
MLNPVGSMYAILLYMVTFTINIPQMLAYIPAPWILWEQKWGERSGEAWSGSRLVPSESPQSIRIKHGQDEPGTGAHLSRMITCYKPLN